MVQLFSCHKKEL